MGEASTIFILVHDIPDPTILFKAIVGVQESN